VDLIDLAANDTSNVTNFNGSRFLGVFTGFPPTTTDYPVDYNLDDFDNAYQIFFPGWFGAPGISAAEFTPFGSTTSQLSFPIQAFRAYQDAPIGNTFSFEVTSSSLNRIKTVTKEDTTFGLGALFAALLSIVNISLTVYALIFPTAPMIVSQTYFRFKEPTKFDPTTLESRTDLSPSRRDMSPKEEIALTTVSTTNGE